LEKYCVCGKSMNIKLRTVIFSKKVTIENVPIYSCSFCERTEVLAEVKPSLTSLIRDLGRHPDKQTVSFQEKDELAYLLSEAVKQERMNVPLELIVKERVNELLDMLLLAQSLNDLRWAEEIQHRLAQIAKNSIAT